jgi:uncharacterized protein with PIN domain
MKEAAKQLQMAESSLRRWLPIMEQSGYVFERKENNRRQLTAQDLLALHELKKLSQIMTLEEACQRVISFIPKEKTADRQADEEVFEQMLAQLPEEIYWHGSEAPIAQLRLQWLKVKSS